MGKLKLVAEPGKHEFTLIREFDAPRELVFKTYTDPKLLPQWWGPRRYETIVDKMEVKEGGRWRYINRASDGSEYGFRGVYHTIASPERLVNTYEFEGMPGHVGLVTTTFEEQNGKTILTETSFFPSVEDRDATLQSGMEEGAGETYDRLEELLKTA